MLEPSTPAPAADRTGRNWSAFLIYFVGFCGGMLTGFHPTILSGFERMQTDAGDTVLNHYFLEHSWRWVSDPTYPASFWSPRFFHPTSGTLTYSENLVGTAPVYWGLRLIVDREIAYQWWILFLSATNFAAMTMVLRWFGVRPLLAVLGGFLFAFGMPRQDQFYHQHLQPHAFAPLAAWFFWKFTRNPERGSWLKVLFLTAWQLLASIHLGWFLAFALGLWFVVIAVVDREWLGRFWTFLKHRPLFTAGTFVLWLGSLWLFFRNYYAGNQDIRRNFHECLWFMPMLTGWFASPPGSIWELHLVPGDQGQYGERHLFTGFGFYLLLLLGFLGVWRCRGDKQNRELYVLALSGLGTALFMAFLALNFGNGISPWYAVYHYFPGAKSIRVPGRIYFSVLLLGLIGGTTALQYLLDTWPTSSARKQFVLGFLVVLCIGEQIRIETESFRRAEFYPRTALLAKEFTDADAVFVHFDPSGEDKVYRHHLICMWAGLDANVPVVNGYSGRTPVGYFTDETNVSDAEVLRFLGDSWRGRLLIVRLGSPVQKQYYDVKAKAD